MPLPSLILVPAEQLEGRSVCPKLLVFAIVNAECGKMTDSSWQAECEAKLRSWLKKRCKELQSRTLLVCFLVLNADPTVRSDVNHLTKEAFDEDFKAVQWRLPDNFSDRLGTKHSKSLQGDQVATSAIPAICTRGAVRAPLNPSGSGACVSAVSQLYTPTATALDTIGRFIVGVSLLAIPSRSS